MNATIDCFRIFYEIDSFNDYRTKKHFTPLIIASKQVKIVMQDKDEYGNELAILNLQILYSDYHPKTILTAKSRVERVDIFMPIDMMIYYLDEFIGVLEIMNGRDNVYFINRFPVKDILALMKEKLETDNRFDQ